MNTTTAKLAFVFYRTLSILGHPTAVASAHIGMVAVGHSTVMLIIING